MASSASQEPSETANMGTPRDYSEDMYRFYFELRDIDGSAKKMIMKFLGEKNSGTLIDLTHGYEFEMPIQAAPDLVRLLTCEQFAVYQVVRFAKVAGVWQHNRSS